MGASWRVRRIGFHDETVTAEGFVVSESGALVFVNRSLRQGVRIDVPARAFAAGTWTEVKAVA